MLRILMNALDTGVVTVRYPAEKSEPPERFRGAPIVPPGTPAFPGCPVGALTATGLDLARCVFCGACAGGSPAVQIGKQFELAARSRRALRIETAADAAAVSSAPNAGGSVAAEIRRLFGRSLHLRHLDAGSCNACDWELTALLNPVYDVRRLGIDFVASPRHADGVVVTGSLTRNLHAAVCRTVEAVPEPRIVVAVGACAASGGIAGESYASAGGIDKLLPVDVYIPGCPPRPEAIIFGLLVALGRLEARRAQ